MYARAGVINIFCAHVTVPRERGGGGERERESARTDANLILLLSLTAQLVVRNNKLFPAE